MADLSTIISQLGFPIFVSVWMLYKTSTDSEAMRKSIDELKNAITLMTNEVTHHYKDEDKNNADS